MSSSDALVRISALAAALKVAKDRTAAAAETLAAAKKDQDRIETEDLPELMRELELKAIVLNDGSKVEVKREIKCGITADNKDAAHEWIKARGDGGLITSHIGFDFEKDEEKAKAKFLKDVAKVTNRPPEIDESIHASRLKSYLKERLEEGDDIPMDLFGLFPYNKVKITPPKAKIEKKAKA